MYYDYTRFKNQVDKLHCPEVKVDNLVINLLLANLIGQFKLVIIQEKDTLSIQVKVDNLVINLLLANLIGQFKLVIVQEKDTLSIQDTLLGQPLLYRRK